MSIIFCWFNQSPALAQNVCVCVCTCASVLAHQSTGSQPILPVGLIPSDPEENKHTQSFSHLASHVTYYVTRSEPEPLAQTLVTEYSRLGSGVLSGIPFFPPTYSLLAEEIQSRTTAEDQQPGHENIIKWLKIKGTMVKFPEMAEHQNLQSDPCAPNISAWGLSHIIRLVWTLGLSLI